jgi:hypothetical protein
MSDSITGMKTGEIIPVGLGSTKELQSRSNILTSGLGEKDHNKSRNKVASESPCRKRLEKRRWEEGFCVARLEVDMTVDGVRGLKRADINPCNGVSAAILVEAKDHINDKEPP